MSRYGLVRVLTVVALAATLLMGSAAPASAMERTQTVKVWGWLESLWRAGLSVWVPGGLAGRKTLSSSEKQGACIDPNGCANQQTTSVPRLPRCLAFNEQGACIDPNG